LPYSWIGTDTLEDTPIEALPELPDDIASRLESALSPYGYVPPPEPYQAGDGDTLWRELNDTALRNLDRWVPAIGLPGLRRSGKGYRAVAAWRGVENANLSIHPHGIKDWGADESYTPLNLVMAATCADLATATAWLAEQIGFESSLLNPDGFDVAAFARRCTNR
jgi:hypothetical protein